MVHTPAPCKNRKERGTPEAKGGPPALQQYKKEMDSAAKKSHTTELTKYKKKDQDQQ